MRVVIADDHALVREGMANLLAGAGHDIVGQAATGQEAWSLLRRLRPDVALLDVALPALSGLEVCRRARRRLHGVAVVLVSMFDDPAWRAEAARAGAAAYVLKGETPASLLDAVERAAQGEMLLPPLQGGGLPLTAREREVVQLIAEGHKLSGIARTLSRSVPTVRAHKASVMRKLGVHSTAELVQAALALGIVRVPHAPEVMSGGDR
ncbi:MAG: response regulator transcription factor [Candidatus Acetothermia bacterium]|nr:response regulator transcription factor [Candidatus Acetothermia bacterium]